jgi:predicted SnoaL-like aldol condensation-catalyzing enzyme
VTAFDKRAEEINTNHIKTFDCPSTTHAHLSQRELQASMDRFASIFYVEKNVESAFDQYVAKNYIQHNPDIADGRDAAVEALTPLFSAKESHYQVGRHPVGLYQTFTHTSFRLQE